LADFKLRKESERAAAAQAKEAQAALHEEKLRRAAHLAGLQSIRETREQEWLLAEKEAAEKQQQQLTKYRELQRLGVDLTAYLVAKAHGPPSRLITVQNGATATTSSVPIVGAAGTTAIANGTPTSLHIHDGDAFAVAAPPPSSSPPHLQLPSRL
jgi:hypothetical protein